jgi:hypothetical protein
LLAVAIVVRFASAYERAATACALSASAGQVAGTSEGTTASRYASTGTLFTTWSFEPTRLTRSLPRYGVPPTWSGSFPGVKVSGGVSAWPSTVRVLSRTSSPGGSSTGVPYASSTRHGAAESSVTRDFPSSRSTRTVRAGCTASVVPV